VLGVVEPKLAGEASWSSFDEGEGRPDFSFFVTASLIVRRPVTFNLWLPKNFDLAFVSFGDGLAAFALCVWLPFPSSLVTIGLVESCDGGVTCVCGCGVVNERSPENLPPDELVTPAAASRNASALFCFAGWVLIRPSTEFPCPLGVRECEGVAELEADFFVSTFLLRTGRLSTSLEEKYPRSSSTGEDARNALESLLGKFDSELRV